MVPRHVLALSRDGVTAGPGLAFGGSVQVAREGVLPRQLEVAMNGRKTGTVQLPGSVWVGVSAVFWEKNVWPHLILRAIWGPQEVPGPYSGISKR